LDEKKEGGALSTGKIPRQNGVRLSMWNFVEVHAEGRRGGCIGKLIFSFLSNNHGAKNHEVHTAMTVCVAMVGKSFDAKGSKQKRTESTK